jgi:hypothetical protein
VAPPATAASSRRSVSESPSRVDGYSRPRRPPRELDRLGRERDGGARRQRGELRAVELAQPAEAREADVLADAHERDPLGLDAQARKLVEDLRDLQLVVEVGLEPQHVLAVGGRRQRGVALLERGAHPVDTVAAVRGVDPVGGGQEARAHLAQLVVADGRHRPLVQHVAPDDQARCQAGLAQRGRGRVAVCDVEGDQSVELPAVVLRRR